ncbi:c-type cytochrome [Paenibacillus sp. GCM10027626]|uniref:c-type cytochrome n=1 Tax=Paenibacillus sp. GCM10027626 TaxID=3273411 RepID=UPI00363BB506
MMMMKKRMLLQILLLALVAMIVLAGCSSKESGGGNTDGLAVTDAEAIYKNRCLGCHGNDLQGRTGPNLQKVGASLTEAELAEKITNGNKGMPAFKKVLKQEEIDALAAWLAEKK